MSNESHPAYEKVLYLLFTTENLKKTSGASNISLLATRY